MPCPEKFRDSLEWFKVDEELTTLICGGYETLVSSSPKKEKAAFFKRAVDIMDEKMEPDRVREILEWCACCKSGAREKASKEFARINAELPIEKKLEKIAQAPYMNMGAPKLTQSGTLHIDAVNYVFEGRFACGCSHFRRIKRDYPVSRSYCYCCGGHFKYHYEIMLGVKLKLLKVVSSPLDSDGAEPCAFEYAIEP